MEQSPCQQLIGWNRDINFWVRCGIADLLSALA
jgi:hypothetical protein